MALQSPRPQLTRVAICDDAPAMRLLVRTALLADPGIVVVAEAGDGLEAIAVIEATRPGVVVLDIGMPKADGLEALRVIRDRQFDTRAVVFSASADPHVVQSAYRLGASHVVNKSAPLSELIAAIYDGAMAPAA